MLNRPRYMKIKPRSRLRNKISRWLRKSLNRLENESNGNMATNGEEHFLRSFLQDHAKKNVTLFDVGANIGEWSDMAVRHARGSVTLHAFEPLIEYKGSGEFNRAAVSDSDGEVVMYKREGDFGLGSMYQIHRFDKKYGEAAPVTVPTVRLDTYIKRNGIQHIDLLKIDVEGHELGVLRGLGEYLRPDFITYIQFEHGANSETGNTLWDLYELLVSKKYKIYKIFPKHLEAAPHSDSSERAEYVNFVAM